MRRIFLPLALTLTASCSSEPQPPAPVVDVVVDDNRTGTLDPGDSSKKDDGDDLLETSGAVFLANIDDDDRNGKPDAEDEVVNGPSDILDLAPIALRPWPLAPAGATARLAIDAPSAKMVRLFRVTGPADDPASYTVVAAPTDITLTAEELQSGVNLAIESKDFVTSTQPGAWSGIVQLTLTATVPDPEKPAPATLEINDSAKLRVAPLILQHNLMKTERVLHTDAGSETRTLAAGIAPAAAAGMVPVEAMDLDSHGLDVDVWAQDFIDFGYTSRPGPNGLPIGMKVAIRSAQPTRSAGAIARRGFLGPDFGFVFKYGTSGGGHSHSMNSFGNWDVIPPYTKDGQSYPLGRNLWGATGKAVSSPDPVFADFIRAQRVQPEINLDTSWLLVGHVDEFTSWVKASTLRGWAMLVASPKDARAMLQTMQMEGRGALKMFETKSVRGQPAARTIDQVMSNATLMAANQNVQIRIDENLAKLVGEIGLQASEVHIMPFLYERSLGSVGAYQPGTVNLLHIDGRVVIPDPFGPLVGGKDPFKEDLRKRLGALGLDVYFADDWDTFHLGGGEVHCGSNAIRTVDVKWWETGR